jgi:IS30 family transposase|tara:strand:- start:11570 stop:12214 length:645 start_codon:yes stop_codon:yes gene_type:complete
MSENPVRECEAEALRLNKEGYSNSAIGQHIGVHRNTIRKWLKKHGVDPKMNGDVVEGKVLNNLIHNTKIKAEHKEVDSDKDQLKEDIEEHFNETVSSAIVEERFRASKAEDVTLNEIAEAQNSPADKYQHYIAAAGIKLLRDSMKGIRAPRTIREMSELDQLIRRNLGLNANTGGGNGGKMQIDISILNNSKADKGGGAIRPKKTIDANTGKEI